METAFNSFHPSLTDNIRMFLLLYVRYRYMQYSTVSIALCSLSTHTVFHCFYCSVFVIDADNIRMFPLLYVRYRHMQYSTVSIALYSLSTHAIFLCFYCFIFVIDADSYFSFFRCVISNTSNPPCSSLSGQRQPQSFWCKFT